MNCWASCSAIRDKVASEGAEILRGWRPWIDRPRFAESAANLASYLALRHHDLRPLQSALMVLGLSSLGRAEGRVLVNLDATLASLASVAGAQVPARPDEAAFFRGNALLAAARDELFGSSGGQRQVRILVTCPSEAADDETFFSRIALAGADAVRINCAHDDADAWRRMIAGARRAEAGNRSPPSRSDGPGWPEDPDGAGASSARPQAAGRRRPAAALPNDAGRSARRACLPGDVHVAAAARVPGRWAAGARGRRPVRGHGRAGECRRRPDRASTTPDPRAPSSRPRRA